MARSAHDAMIIARENKEFQHKNWDEIKRDVMKQICRAKLDQHGYVRKGLLSLAGRPIIEVSPVDSFWGWGPDQNGRNELGKIWEELRDELLSVTEP